MTIRLDLTGKKFGKLTVIKYAESKNKSIYWLCQCDCGGTKVAHSTYLRNGRTSHCGCDNGHTTHGESRRTKLYTTWANIKSRCNDSKKHDYRWYGAKGIKVCDEWLNNYEAFRDWALANGYQDNLTIDRIDSNGDYCPDNCRWITRQANTSRAVRHSLIELVGQKFGRLTVLQHAGLSLKGAKTQWLCECGCGNYKIIKGASLKIGNTKSCGCLITEHAINNLKNINKNRITT